MTVKNSDQKESRERFPETDVAVLGLLAEKPSYGYELERRVDSRNMRNWTRMEQSSIYNSLKRLERKGLVSSERKEADGRLRRIYYPTESGYRALKEQVYTYISVPQKELTGFDLGVGNIYALSREEVIKALTAYNESLEKGIEFLRVSAERMRTFGISIAAWLFERPLAEAKARSLWISQFIEELKETNFPNEEEKQ